ncbi:hypothetical protein F5X68DRAFT_238482 [Plectosphaerella plurivora]|uniref:Zn(2)-C6 fungal-type domain-containing protein n=1 Tax=Plectosphaerella plurivora TaxID=936078 RepID=A0A9P9AGZ9_9PEZI|nr:hypothetical protein F5X68DRAFT_238482 [Plectosphaerella plurivora]
MTQTKTSLERDNPPPRRKSCLACTKARRRCDQATPSCQRCAQRTIACQYPAGARPRRMPAAGPTLSPSESIPGLFDLPTTPQASFDMLGTVEPSDDLFGGLGSNLNFMDLEADPGRDMSLDLINPPPLTTTQLALVPSRLATNAQKTRALTTRLQYGVDQVIAAPRLMVSENYMPWCHAHLYDDGMPRSMQDAVSSAALHAAKNDRNTRVIRDCIESRVQDLLSSPSPFAPLDLLARAQALFMYQTLRLSDPDPRVRLSYDATMPHLEESAYALLPHITFHDPAEADHAPDPLPLYPIAAARDAWLLWIFMESARRTLAMILFFVVAHRFVRGEMTQCNTNKYVSRSVTLSAHLWQAKDPVDFALAWRNKRHYVVHGDSMDAVVAMLEDAKSDDIDELGKIFLASVMGRDEAKGWLALRGASL